MNICKNKRKKFKASFTIEAAIAVGFIFCFLSMSISYEMNLVHGVLEEISIQKEEQKQWKIQDEIEEYIKINEVVDVVEQVTGLDSELD